MILQPTWTEIEPKIAILNRSEVEHDRASSHEEQKAADERWQEAHDWLVQRKVPFYRDTNARMWRYGTKSE